MADGDEANSSASGADPAADIPEAIIRIPAKSKWFCMDAIHDIEKKALSEFFNGRNKSKTPAVYKIYRDFMIKVWSQAPKIYLTGTCVRRHLVGDVCAILRVHAFLEQWGLINYKTDPDSKPALKSSLRPRNSTSGPIQLDGPLRDHANGVPRSLFFYQPRPQKRAGPALPLQKPVKAAKKTSAEQPAPSLLSRRELYATAAATDYKCDHCGSDCSRMRYHCVGNADIELCPSCFADGKYPDTLSVRDFEQLNTASGSEAHVQSAWSEAEVILLLEGLEKFNDWRQVSEHVGTKTKSQCMRQFLRLPIEDSFLGDQIGKWYIEKNEAGDTNVIQEGGCEGGPEFAGSLLPFADMANPIMAQVAFLASSVSPEVAAAAAQASLDALMSEYGEQSTDASGKADANLDAVTAEATASDRLAATVAKAKSIADAGSREIERLSAMAVDAKVRVVDMKLQEFDRLDQYIRRERERLQRERQKVYADRVRAALMRMGGPT